MFKETTPPQPKPLLTAEQQIAHMKSKGIAFDLCAEAEAAAYLRDKCQFFRVYAYRKLFDKYVGGERDGQYIGLDFGHLKLLSGLDRHLRDALLPMTLDVEHFAKVRLLAAAEDHNEDGYAVMRDYLASVSEGQRAYLDSEFDRRERDAYCGSLVRKYRRDMPLWVFCEVVSFGGFLGLMRFCAERWDDAELTRAHYLLKKAKSVRNFCAHGACSLNDLSAGGPAREKAPLALLRAMADAGISKRLRLRRLESPRMVQICTLLYAYSSIVPDGLVRSERASALRNLFKCSARVRSSLPPQNQAVSAISFIERLTGALGLLD